MSWFINKSWIIFEKNYKIWNKKLILESLNILSLSFK